MKYICSRKKTFGIRICKDCEHTDDGGRDCPHGRPHIYQGVFCDNCPSCIEEIEFIEEKDFLI